MREDQQFNRRVQPSWSLILWFLGVTAFMVAIAHYA